MFEAKRFLTVEVGKPQDVLSLFSSYGLQTPQSAAVDKWFRRDSISGAWLARLLCLLELERGGPVSLSSYIKTKGPR